MLLLAMLRVSVVVGEVSVIFVLIHSEYLVGRLYAY